MNMDDLEDIIREDLERSSGNNTETSDCSQPSVPSRPTQPTQPCRILEPSPETAQPPVSARRDTEHSYLNEAVAPSTPIAPIAPVTPIAPVACAGAGTIPYPSTKPYLVMVGKPVIRKSEVVTPVASTSRDCAGASSVLPGNPGPYVVIVEQPEPSRRFRYSTEISSAGAIHGVNYTKNSKSFPKIKIGNYTGPAVITVSLVCKKKPFKVHPNGIVGEKKFSEEDFTYIYVKKVLVTRNSCVIQFDDLGIRVVKPNQIKEALQLREAQGIDPFNQGYNFTPERDDLQAVRLCFQVSLVTQQLDPVVSDVIYHSKKLGCLNIRRMCGCSGKKSGGQGIIFLSKELHPKDLEVVFYEEENGTVVWEECVRIFEVYERSAIVCSAPAYTRAGVQADTEVTVSIALRRRSDSERGDPRPFTYIADNADVIMKKRKKIRDVIQKYAEKNWTPPASLPPDNVSQNDQDWQKLPPLFDFNSAMPGPSFVDPATPGPSFVNPAMPRPSFDNPTMPAPNFVNPAMRGPSFVNPAMPRPSFDNLTMPAPSFVNPAIQGPSFVNPATPGPSFVNPATPGPSFDNPPMLGLSFVNPAMLRQNSVNPTMPGMFNFNSVIPGPNSTRSRTLGMLEPLSVAPAVSKPTDVTPDEPGLSSNNPFLPGPSQFQLMQTNIPLSPDMDPMSVSEDEGVLSPNGHLDKDGGIPSVDTILADACADLLDF